MGEKKEKKSKKEKKEVVAAPPKKEKKSKKEKKEKKEKPAEIVKRKRDDSETPSVKKGANGATMDVAKWRSEHSVKVCEAGEKYNPVGFANCGLPADILKCTSSFAEPTPIQAQSWPAIMDSKDVVGIAKTGSGKTYAFMLPALVNARKNGLNANYCKPRGLVLAPTRELCSQIAKVGYEAGQMCGLNVVCVYGGVPKDPQRQELRNGVEVVVATPGRLKDLMSEGSRTLCLSAVNFAVLDEADRMLDMGFEDDVRSILAETCKDKQMLMFSATWPDSIKGLAKEFLRNPVRIIIGSTELAANHAITQKVEFIQEENKFRRLCDLLKEYHGYEQKNRVIVFALYKKEAARLEQQLQRQQWNCVAIQGDATQAARNAAFEKFKSGQVPLLIATDVAARGLDIKGVEYVINCSFPLTVEDYVHRIGRTGRAGQAGFAHSLFTIADKQLGPQLIRVLEEAKQEVPADLEKFRHVAMKKPPPQKNSMAGKDGGFKGEIPSGNKITFDSDSD